MSFSCSSNIDATAGAGTCGVLQSSIGGLYDSTFSNATASIFVQFGTTGLGESLYTTTDVSYTAYRNALIAHEGDANDATAVSTLPSSEPSTFGAGNVQVTTALAAALGLSGIMGIESDGVTLCSTPGTGNCYNGIITIATPNLLPSGQSYYYRSGAQDAQAYDFYSVIEHEADEVLGTGSCIGTRPGATNTPRNECGGSASAADLFRYSAAGTRSYVSSGNGATAYFSIDGGVTIIADYNNSPNFEDYGDWSASCQKVQDAIGCPGKSFDITNDGGAEISVLDAVGFNLSSSPTSSTPEPSTLAMFAGGIALLASVRRQRG